MPARLYDRYQKEILPGLAKKLGRTNQLSLPKLEKVVVNMGVGKALQDKNRIEQAQEQLGQITGNLEPGIVGVFDLKMYHQGRIGHGLLQASEFRWDQQSQYDAIEFHGLDTNQRQAKRGIVEKKWSSHVDLQSQQIVLTTIGRRRGGKSTPHIAGPCRPSKSSNGRLWGIDPISEPTLC